MKTPHYHQNPSNRKNNDQRVWLQTIVETQIFALQNELQLPPVRAIWRVIDSKSGKENRENRRKEP